jgi:hypothetical protein
MPDRVTAGEALWLNRCEAEKRKHHDVKTKELLSTVERNNILH